MQEPKSIASLLLVWRDLTVEEGDAIRQQDWTAVSKCQEAKSALADSITEAGERWDNDPARNLLRLAPWRTHFCTQLSGLMELEKLNEAALTVCRSRAAREMDQIQFTGRNLRAVRNSYAQVPQACWNAYS